MSTILYNTLYPDQPNVRFYEKKLKDMTFPVVFKICFDNEFETEKMMSVGYDRIWDFYRGRSRYNESLYGWNGHTEDGSTLGSEEGTKYSLFFCFLFSFLKLFKI